MTFKHLLQISVELTFLPSHAFSEEYNILSSNKVSYSGELKKTLRSSQDSNLGSLNSGQMLLLIELLELWHWSRG